MSRDMTNVKTGLDRRSVILRGGAAAAGALGATLGGVALAGPAMAVGATFNPINPYRTIDSRSMGKIRYDELADFEVFTDANGTPRIPSNALAVTFNLTVTQTGTPGYLAVYPGDTPDDGFGNLSTLNWTTSNLDLANGGTVRLGVSPVSGAGSVAVLCGGFTNTSTHFIMDITGYYG